MKSCELSKKESLFDIKELYVVKSISVGINLLAAVSENPTNNLLLSESRDAQ